MKKRNSERLYSTVWLLTIAAMLFVMLPSIGRAACPSTSTTDTDSDGFTDAQECDGFVSSIFGTVNGYNAYNANPALPRNQYLDPSSRDLFVIIFPATPSLFPSNPTATIPAGLGIAAHEGYVTSSPASRVVTSGSTQQAIMVTENLDSTMKDSKGNYLPFGNSNYGTPNGLDGATIWSQRISNYIKTVACPVDQNCQDSVSGAVGWDAVIAAYIRNTFSHEGGHVMKLTTTSNSKYGGYHYATGSNTVMEQSIVYKNGVFTIPQGYQSTDPQAAKLK